jgi:EAL and modified HD-GYP domain-containing signal transduction protein
MGMQPHLDPREGAYVARQPILDPTGQVFGYELLYRAAADAVSCQDARDTAAARVLNDAVLTLGLDTLTGGRRAFINVTRQMLMNDLITVLSPDTIVVELLEDVGVDDEIVAACRRLREKGYSLALDDFTLDAGAENLLPFVRYVKIDVLSTTPEERRAIQRLVPPGVKLVAEKVESVEIFEEARALGYSLFQGYYFCRPTTFTGGALSARRLAYARLLSALNRPNVNVNSVEDLIKHDASLTYRVLRCINSAAFGIRREIQSIRQALVLLGLDQVRKWASVWALAGLNGGSSSELVTIAILRARSCEIVAAHTVGADDASEYFLLGLCSLLDAMLGQPMCTAVAELPLSENIRQALLGEQNTARRVLDSVIAHERGEWDEASRIAETLAVTPEHLPIAYADALKWARELSQTAAAA